MNRAQQYYLAHEALFAAEPELSHILVNSEREARALLTRMDAGEPFAALAAECSLCPSGKDGGALGRMATVCYVPEFAEALSDLNTVGQVIGPVRSRFGFHLIRMDGERRAVSFEECEEILNAWLEMEDAAKQGRERFSYPATRLSDFSEELGGYQNRDPYQWLEDAKDPEVLNWVSAQNRCTDDYFDPAAVQERAAALKATYPCCEYAVPKAQNGRLYTVRTDGDGSMTPVILDENWQELCEVGAELAEEFILCGILPDPVDERLVALTVMPHGAHLLSAIVYDLETKQICFRADDSFGAVWADDGALWYAQSLPNRAEGYNDNPVWRWTAAGGAVKVYEAPRGRAYVTLAPGKGGRMMIDSKYDFGSNELLCADADGHVESLTGDVRAKNVYCGTHNGTHYILTEHGAPMGKVIADGKTVIPESRRMLISAVVTKRGLLAAFMEDACLRMELYGFDGGLLERIPLPDACGALGGHAMELTPPTEGYVYFSFESFLLPLAMYAWSEEDGSLKKVFSVSDEQAPEDIVAEEIFVTARDGVQVPAFVVHRKDVALDGENPVLMYGYGGYNLAMPPAYTNIFVGLRPWEWAQRGGVYVNCNLRGGNEYGVSWHEAGMLKNKKNAFHDFIDIAEWLIANHWTRAGKIAICGGSNGGLLMTALTTMRPDLLGCVIASVPHTDMLRFVNDPAGPRYITEYGNPRDPDMLPYLLSYSPFHNVWERPYPPIYVQTGERDNNVPPYHGKKFAARMQERSTGGPVLLRVLAEGSHDRGQGDVMFRTFAEMQLFVERHLGM